MRREPEICFVTILTDDGSVITRLEGEEDMAKLSVTGRRRAARRRKK